MRIGFIGLGNVGGKLSGSLIRNGINLEVHDLNADLVAALEAHPTLTDRWDESRRAARGGRVTENLFAPDAPQIRIAPLDDEAATSLFRLLRRAALIMRYMPATSHYDRALFKQKRDNSPFDIVEQPLWLMRGTDRTGKNDFTRGHELWNKRYARGLVADTTG